ncbi:MAG: hypothetical protein WD845_09070 [Pirellulales bacterium]
MIQIDGKPIYGLHSSPMMGAPALMAQRTAYSGVIGESEILQGSKGRLITFEIKIFHQFQSWPALAGYLHLLDQMVGQVHGELHVAPGPHGGLDDSFHNCTFEGFARKQDGLSGPLADMTGLLDGVTPSWWVDGYVAFYQLSVADDAGSGA